jgi:CRP-like cAMP-binding protein
MIVIMSNSLVDTLLKLTGREQKLAAGDTLFRASDPVLSLFLVSAGAFRLVRTLPHSFQLTLQRAGPGAVLAEASLFTRNYHCDALAVENSVLRVVSLQQVRDTLRHDPEFATALTRHLAHEVHRARAQTEILSLKTVAERIDAWMTLNDGELPPKGRWRQIASEIGVSTEALYRELARRR